MRADERRRRRRTKRARPTPQRTLARGLVDGLDVGTKGDARVLVPLRVVAADGLHAERAAVAVELLLGARRQHRACASRGGVGGIGGAH